MGCNAHVIFAGQYSRIELTQQIDEVVHLLCCFLVMCFVLKRTLCVYSCLRAAFFMGWCGTRYLRQIIVNCKKPKEANELKSQRKYLFKTELVCPIAPKHAD